MKELSGRTVFLILLAFGSILFCWVWAGQRALDFEGPSHMHMDTAGNLYVQVGNHLFQYASDGTFIRDHNLTGLGIETLTGDFAFFANGDLLLTRQQYAPSFLERFSILRRERDTTPESTQNADTGLFRCRLTDWHCERFDKAGLNLSRAFHLYIDPGTDEVYLSEAARHMVRKFDSAGEEIARIEKDLLFPNQIFVHDNELYIANTNRHEIRIVSAAAADFGRLLRSVKVDVNKDVTLDREIWPSAMLLHGDRLWANNMENGMKNGGLYLFDSRGLFKKRLPLPDVPLEADPLDLVAFNGEVLVADYANFTVQRFDYTGKLLVPPFEVGVLQSYLAQQKKDRELYRQLAELALWSFWLAVGIGFLVAMIQAFDSGSIKSLSSQGVVEVDIRNPAIVWIEVAPSFRRQMRIVGISMPGVGGMLILMMLYSGKFDPGMVLMIVMLGAFTVYCLFFAGKTRIGVLGDILILMKGPKKSAAGRGEQILYSDNFLFIGRIGAVLANNNQSIFPKKQLIDHVYPVLKNATEVTRAQAQTLLLRSLGKEVWILVAGITAISILAFTLAV